MNLWSRDLILCVILYQYTKYLIMGEVMAIFPKSKIAAAAISFMQKWWFWLCFVLHSVILHQSKKFDENPPIHDVEMAFW